MPEFLAGTQELFDVLDMIEDARLSDNDLMDIYGGCFMNSGYADIVILEVFVYLNPIQKFLRLGIQRMATVS
ncbi:MAG: hypothetical protein WDO19_03180 [Bacteroidota bacterium]